MLDLEDNVWKIGFILTAKGSLEWIAKTNQFSDLIFFLKID